MRVPPPGTKFPIPNADVAAGLKGYIVRVAVEGTLASVRGRVTGELTEDGQIEVMIVGEED